MTRWFRSLSAEEQANTLTHLIATVATLLIAWPLLRLAITNNHSPITNNHSPLLGTGLFLFGMLLMFLSSTLYHAVTAPDAKRRLRVFDHIAIYVMIAGSYSLLCTYVLGGWMGWSLFVFLWACVIAGIVGKILVLGKYPKLSLALYLIMGWVALIVLVPLWQRLPHEAFWWIIAEGIFYTVGAYFFHGDEEHPFYHAIWHVFIILGAAAHTFATFIILG